MSERIELEDGASASLERTGPNEACPLVIVPALGVPGHAIEPFRKHLSRSFDVWTVELPGTGDASSIPLGHSTRDLAHELLEVLEKRNLGQRAHLFGISLGGMIAQWAAIDGRERFDRVVLASTSARGLRSDALTRAPGKKLQLALALFSKEPNAELARIVLDDAAPAAVDAIREQPHSATDLFQLALAAAFHDVREELPRLLRPTLVIGGTQDDLITPESHRDLAARIPGARYSALEGAGHDVAVERPSELAERVRAFLLDRAL